MLTMYIEPAVYISEEIQIRLNREYNRKIDHLNEVDIYWAHPSCPVTNITMSMYPNCKYIISNTTSRYFISSDVKQKVLTLEGEEVLNNITSTPEHTLALMLALHRNLIGASESTVYAWYRANFIAPSMLSNMNLCIYGYGRIGSRLDHICRPLFKHIFSIDKNTSLGYINESLYYSDIVSLHITPSQEDLQPIFSRDKIQKMKKDALLINTSRSEVLDHKALLQALHNKDIRGAALDTLPGEFEVDFPRDNSIAWDLINYSILHKNLLLTPHIGGSTKDALLLTQTVILNKLEGTIQ